MNDNNEETERSPIKKIKFIIDSLLQTLTGEEGPEEGFHEVLVQGLVFIGEGIDNAVELYHTQQLQTINTALDDIKKQQEKILSSWENPPPPPPPS